MRKFFNNVFQNLLSLTFFFHHLSVLFDSRRNNNVQRNNRVLVVYCIRYQDGRLDRQHWPTSIDREACSSKGTSWFAIDRSTFLKGSTAEVRVSAASAANAGRRKEALLESEPGMRGRTSA